MSTPIQWFVQENMRLVGSKSLKVGVRPPPPIPNCSTQFNLHLPNNHVTLDANGQLRTNETGVDEQDIYLNDFRHMVILGVNGQPSVRDHEPAARDFPGDYTSFREHSRHWGPSRSQLPDIVFQVRRTELPNYTVDFMKFRGRLVLDWRGHPIKNYRHSPIFISVQVEGWRMEALMRLDPRVTLEDIVATMILTRGELNHKNPMTLMVNRVQRRQRKFRLFNRCTLWAASVPENEVPFAQLLQDELTPAMLAANSTRDLTPLTGEEFVSLENIGNPPVRAGPKVSISRDERGYAAYYFKSEDSYTIDFPEWLFYTGLLLAINAIMPHGVMTLLPIKSSICLAALS